jgi:hypothetical protein
VPPVLVLLHWGGGVCRIASSVLQYQNTLVAPAPLYQEAIAWCCCTAVPGGRTAQHVGTHVLHAVPGGHPMYCSTRRPPHALQYQAATPCTAVPGGHPMHCSTRRPLTVALP